MTRLIQEKIKSLRNEITAMDLTSSLSNLKITKYDKNRVMCLKAKIQVLNEIIISFGIQK